MMMHLYVFQPGHWLGINQLISGSEINLHSQDTLVLKDCGFKHINWILINQNIEKTVIRLF